jgi:hypothetical protein
MPLPALPTLQTPHRRKALCPAESAARGRGRPARAVLAWWDAQHGASTNVHNLHTDPAGCMVASAFFPAGSAGTLVSEGILGYRASHGTLSAAARFITDVGPSYVVVAAIAVGLLFGGWTIRTAAALDLAVCGGPGYLSRR